MVSSGLHLIFQSMDLLYFGHEVIKVMSDFEMNPGYEIQGLHLLHWDPNYPQLI